MATFLEQLQTLTSGSSVSTDISAQASQLTQLAQQIQQLLRQPPGDFGSYLSQLQQLPLPQLSVAADLGQSLNSVLPDLQGELGGLLQPLLDAAGQIEQQVGGGLVDAVQPLLNAIGQLRQLLATDWSCGLVPALAPPAPSPVPAPGPPGPDPAPPQPPPPVLAPAQVDQAKAAIDSLPADMTVPALLKWLHGHIGTYRPGYFFFRSIPVLDDLRDPLDTLVRWEGFTGDQLAAELAQTLNAVAAVIRASSADLVRSAFSASALPALPAQDLANAGTALADALQALTTAVQAADLPAVATQLAAAQTAATQLESANATLDGQEQSLRQVQAQWRDLPGQLETAICRLLVLLQPRATWGDLSERLGESPTVLSDQTFAPLTEVIARVREFLENLLGLLDVAAVTQPLTDVFNRAGSAIGQLDQGIAQLTASARAQFQQAHDALQALNLDAVRQQAEQALQQAAQQVQQTLGQGLGAAAAALGQALTAIDGALASLDPEQLAQPVREVLESIEQLFQDPAFQQAIERLQQLAQYAQRLEDLSFRPVTDLVIDGIGEVKSALDSIDESKLPPPAPEMIQGAISVLPTSLTPLTDPLVAKLDDLIDQGPIALLEQLKDLPKTLSDRLQQFSPRALLEEPLGAPFRQLQERLDEFQPAQWLDAAAAELDALRQRIAQSLDLRALLAPVAHAQQQLITELGRFRPGAVLAPLTDRLEQVIHGLATALPTSELTDGLDQVLNRVRRITGTLAQANQVVQAFVARIAQVADPSAQLDQWLGDILAKLPNNTPATLAASLTAIAQAVSGAKAAQLQAAYETERGALGTRLAAANPQALLARLLQAKSRLTTALVDALPDSPEKASLQAWLATFDPAAPSFSRGLRLLAQLRDALTATEQDLTTRFAQWDARYHRPDGTLASLLHDSVGLDDLGAWLRQAIDRQLGAPVLGFLEQLKLLGALLGTFAQAIGSLLQAVEAKINAVLAAPIALAAAAHQLEQLQDRLAHLDLDLFTREVDSLYEALLDKVRALDPQTLAQPLQQRLEELLGALSLDAVFTPALRQQLDQSYQTLRDKINGLDPDILLIEPLEELYENNILPLADALDVSEAVQIIIDRFDQFPDELKAELGRVDTAYQEMLRAVPGGSPAGGGAAVGVGG